MEEQCSTFSWGYSYQEEGNEELKYSFLYTLELENTIVSAKEEIAKREFEIICLKDVLNRTMKERDEVETKCQSLILENHSLQKQIQLKQKKQQEEIEDESKAADPKKHFIISPVSVDTSLITSPNSQQQPLPLLPKEASLSLMAEKKPPLPEKGKLLKAVMEAGPLLQTLLLAGPLPQWQHPPPQLDSIEIPPVAAIISSSSSPPRQLSNQGSFSSINSGFSNKRVLSELNEDSDSSPRSKFQKLASFH